MLEPHLTEKGNSGELSKENAFYALEDILGGSTAVACITLR